MQLRFLLPLALLLGITLASSHSLRQGDPYAVLSEIDGSPFGNMILSTIAIQMASNSPLDELAVSLNQIRKTLEKQNEDDENHNRTNQAQCEQIIGTFQNQITIHTQQRHENTKILDTNKAALNQANTDLRESLQALMVNGKRLSEGQAQRDSQHSDYANSMGEHDQGIKAIDSALQLLSHLKSGASFIQLKHRISKVAESLIETQKTSSKGHLYTPLIESLNQLAEKASPELLDKITRLFNDLRNTFVKDKQTLTNIETQQLESWISLKTDLETERETLQTKRADLERQIEGYTSIIKDATKNIKFHTSELTQAKENLASQENSCKTLANSFSRRRDERKRELNIIQRIIENFDKKMKTMSDYIKGRIEKTSL